MTMPVPPESVGPWATSLRLGQSLARPRVAFKGFPEGEDDRMEEGKGLWGGAEPRALHLEEPRFGQLLGFSSRVTLAARSPLARSWP